MKWAAAGRILSVTSLAPLSVLAAPILTTIAASNLAASALTVAFLCLEKKKSFPVSLYANWKRRRVGQVDIKEANLRQAFSNDDDDSFGCWDVLGDVHQGGVGVFADEPIGIANFAQQKRHRSIQILSVFLLKFNQETSAH